jgi:hypothetical protein
MSLVCESDGFSTQLNVNTLSHSEKLVTQSIVHSLASIGSMVSKLHGSEVRRLPCTLSKQYRYMVSGSVVSCRLLGVNKTKQYMFES